MTRQPKYEWKVAENELPMWVADMDFRTAPEILDALKSRLDHGVFGYTDVPDAWYNAYINWWGRRHHLKMEKENLIFSAGVMPSIFSVIERLAAPGEIIVIQSPVYNNFYNCIENSDCNVVENKLLYKNGAYAIDFTDLEQKLSNPQTTVMILCNPHNPIGKIWSAEDLAKIGELAKKYNVTVISDEIHCDITEPGKYLHCAHEDFQLGGSPYFGGICSKPHFEAQGTACVVHGQDRRAQFLCDGGRDCCV